MFNIVLHEPEKPDNTGNIGRTCVATGSALHLIYPIGFQLTRKNIHHAGLDYWERLKLFTHDSYNEFLEYIRRARPYEDVGAQFTSPSRGEHCEPTLWFATTKAHKSYTDVKFNDGDFIMFGKESAGIPEEILASDEEHCIRIPMIENERSLNLSNSVAIVLYEALRQNNFNGLVEKGELHNLKYK
ncbi:MAG: tRNA (cytidine(34)-2'-O)-methyltransferase [Lachnospiraceae bacterium]|nr:tRNA (cytidine(34)-2'-O)-methyltransferase [Lachnospiraceae bacterium]